MKKENPDSKNKCADETWRQQRQLINTIASLMMLLYKKKQAKE